MDAAPAQVVGILGGMGPAAGADFVRLFVEACARQMHQLGLAVRDQAFPEHWLAQVPVPDRTGALLSEESGAHQPLEPMLQALGRLAALGARSVAIACNTAHAWHGRLQERFPHVQVLHVARELALQLQADQCREVILLATEGTYRSGLYDATLAQAGIAVQTPDAWGRERLMEGIYQGVKRGDLALAQRCFGEVSARMQARHGPLPLVMACTEIPLALPGAREVQGQTLIDPARVLAQALARQAYRQV
ncbi:MAG: aspartate/glutamate racemase family protein [Curvibacter sp.]|nr:aspartate/glutamate racemase family protein [Curvibacter sp.]